MIQLGVPCALASGHRVDDFRCSALALTRWLQERAHRNQVSGASRCFVVCDAQQNVLGYYALAAGAVSHGVAPGSIRRNMPHPIPVIVLGRLAVHADWTGQGIGAGLLKDAVQRTLHVCREIGARALVCHAMDEMAKAFYLRHGFIESPMDAMTVMLPVT